MPKPTIESERIRIRVKELCVSLNALKHGILPKTYNTDQQTAFSKFHKSIGQLGYEVSTAVRREKQMRREVRVWREAQISNDRDGDESISAAHYDKSNVVDGNVPVDFAQILTELGTGQSWIC
jgi:hypothetical protein